MTSPNGARSTWSAVAWAEGLILVGLVLLGAAIATSLRFCTFTLGCDDQSSSGGAGSLILLVLGLVALAGSPFVAARRSGWPAPARAAALAVLASAAAAVLGAVVFGVLVDDVLPALVVALGVAGGLAVRPPSGRAVPVRLAVVGALVVLAGVFGAESLRSDGAILVLAFLTLPAIGLADTISG